MQSTTRQAPEQHLFILYRQTERKSCIPFDKKVCEVWGYKKKTKRKENFTFGFLCDMMLEDYKVSTHFSQLFTSSLEGCVYLCLNLNVSVGPQTTDNTEHCPVCSWNTGAQVADQQVVFNLMGICFAATHALEHQPNVKHDKHSKDHREPCIGVNPSPSPPAIPQPAARSLIWDMVVLCGTWFPFFGLHRYRKVETSMWLNFVNITLPK